MLIENDDVEQMRQNNMKELGNFLAQALKNDGIDLSELNDYAPPIVLAVNKKLPRKKSSDTLFKFTGNIPLERRHSARIRKETPKYSYDDLPEEDARWSGKIRYSDSCLDDLENVVYERRKRYSAKSSVPALTVPVEEITDDYLSKVAMNSNNKDYSQYGTSCHQCRQKTTDSKTYCRSGSCIGVRGQFCGPCLLNRYGEDVKVVLLDPNWSCPVCRKICNCSICRNREGKRPTGILAPIAQKHGHNSVKDFLLSLQGKGDFTNKENSDESIDDESPMKEESGIKIKSFFKIKSPKKKIKTMESHEKETIEIEKDKVLLDPKKKSETFENRNYNEKEKSIFQIENDVLLGFQDGVPVFKKMKQEADVLLGFDENSLPVFKNSDINL